MAEPKGGIRFVRIRGRVVPMRERITNTTRGAALVTSGYLLQKISEKPATGREAANKGKIVFKEFADIAAQAGIPKHIPRETVIKSLKDLRAGSMSPKSRLALSVAGTAGLFVGAHYLVKGLSKDGRGLVFTVKDSDIIKTKAKRRK